MWELFENADVTITVNANVTMKHHDWWQNNVNASNIWNAADKTHPNKGNYGTTQQYYAPENIHALRNLSKDQQIHWMSF